MYLCERFKFMKTNFLIQGNFNQHTWLVKKITNTFKLCINPINLTILNKKIGWFYMNMSFIAQYYYLLFFTFEYTLGVLLTNIFQFLNFIFPKGKTVDKWQVEMYSIKFPVFDCTCVKFHHWVFSLCFKKVIINLNLQNL